MTATELLSYLTDRPCEACKFHGENGCCKWNCVFDEKPTHIESEEDKDIYDRLLNMLNDTRELIKQLEDRGLDDQLVGAIKVVDIITRNVGGDIDEHRSGNE